MVEMNACSEPEHIEAHMHLSLPYPLGLLHLRLTTLLFETGRVNRVFLSSSTDDKNYSNVDLHQLPHAHHCFHLLCAACVVRVLFDLFICIIPIIL